MFKLDTYVLTISIKIEIAKMTRLLCLTILSLTIFLSSPSFGAEKNWSNCASDLDYIRRRADDASSASEYADEKQRRFKSIEEEFNQCINHPEVFDLLRDGCKAKSYELDSARTTYRSSLETLQSRLKEVDSKIRNATESCGFDFSSLLGQPMTRPIGTTPHNPCSLYVSYKGRIPKQSLLEVCSKEMSADECRKCLK